MRTPAGKECPFFYGNYFRGRNEEECRLVDRPGSPAKWKSDLCQNCPVPDIARANSCTHMILDAQVQKTFLGFKRQVKVTAYCTKNNCPVKEPHIGCGSCHPLPPIFEEKLK